MYDRAKIEVGTVREQSNCLAILVVLLDVPRDPNRVGNIVSWIVNDLQLALKLVKKGKILGGKCCYDLAARWVNVVIELWLGCLHVFTHLGANVLTKSNYISKEVAVWVWVVGVTSQFGFGKDGVIKES
jgi:hypothetical protein